MGGQQQHGAVGGLMMKNNIKTKGGRSAKLLLTLIQKTVFYESKYGKAVSYIQYHQDPNPNQDKSRIQLTGMAGKSTK